MRFCRIAVVNVAQNSIYFSVNPYKCGVTRSRRSKTNAVYRIAEKSSNDEALDTVNIEYVNFGVKCSVAIQGNVKSAECVRFYSAGVRALSVKYVIV